MPLLCATRVNNASKYIYPWVPHGSISGKKPYRIKNYDCISATTIRNPIPLFDICTNTGSKEKDIMSEYYLSLPRSASGFYLLFLFALKILCLFVGTWTRVVGLFADLVLFLCSPTIWPQLKLLLLQYYFGEEQPGKNMSSFAPHSCWRSAITTNIAQMGFNSC